MAQKPTGHLIRHEGELCIAFERILHASRTEVWTWLTRPAYLAGWLGELAGSPSTGAVRFRLAPEAADPDAEPDEELGEWVDVAILECARPARFAADLEHGDRIERMYWHLGGQGHLTTLTLGWRLRSPAEASAVGARWDYRLDRLVAAQQKSPMPDRGDYGGALSAAYEAIAGGYQRVVADARHG